MKENKEIPSERIVQILVEAEMEEENFDPIRNVVMEEAIKTLSNNS